MVICVYVRCDFWIRRINWSDGDLQEQEARTVFFNARRFCVTAISCTRFMNARRFFSKFCGGAAGGGAAGGGAAGGGAAGGGATAAATTAATKAG